LIGNGDPPPRPATVISATATSGLARRSIPSLGDHNAAGRTRRYRRRRPAIRNGRRFAPARRSPPCRLLGDRCAAREPAACLTGLRDPVMPPNPSDDLNYEHGLRDGRNGPISSGVLATERPRDSESMITSIFHAGCWREATRSERREPKLKSRAPLSASLAPQPLAHQGPQTLLWTPSPCR
jgi:hypothetical protein